LQVRTSSYNSNKSTN